MPGCMTQAKQLLGCILPGTYEIRKFVNYSITKYIKFQSIRQQQKHTFDQCQMKLSSMETVSDIVLHIVQEFFNESLMAILCWLICQGLQVASLRNHCYDHNQCYRAIAWILEKLVGHDNDMRQESISCMM